MGSGQSTLVVGATGKQGGAVAKELLRGGFAVRALTRDPTSPAASKLAERGAEIVRGDLDVREDLERAVQGVDAVFSVQDPWAHGEASEIRQAALLAEIANAAGVRRFVQASVAAADLPTGLPHFESKGVIERHLATLGMDAYAIRPVFFMESLVERHHRIAPLILGMLKLGLGDRALQLISVRDIGRTAAEAILAPDEPPGLKVINLAGDELTFSEIISAFERATGAAPKVSDVQWADVRRIEERAYLNYRWMGEHGWSFNLDAQRAERPWLERFEDRLRREVDDTAGAPAA
ncbi:NmrA/HSCARG family protein [Phenylobacterium sp.]|uniref:NmrA/HSCARG family protein n=1 Tax=Phenylobacterium sp. TaxID=1871053 RepID=UPI002FC9E25E